jgi:hypothetical protein
VERGIAIQVDWLFTLEKGERGVRRESAIDRLKDVAQKRGSRVNWLTCCMYIS